MSAFFEAFSAQYNALFAWLFSELMQPALYTLGLMNYWDEAYAGTEIVLLGMIEIALLALIVLPLQRVMPAETKQDGAAIRTDFIYTLINRLGLLPLITFALLFPLESELDSLSHEMGWPRLTLEGLAPWFIEHQFAAFCIYLLMFDLVGYWIHRAQHGLNWWWELHAVHHSQQSMTVWTDSRNHFLDDLLTALIIALVARAIGTPGSQFIWLVFISRVVESLSHANVRHGYGVLGRLIVDPLFHRTHHAIGLGHEGPHGGCNFGVLFPFWDLLFRSHNFTRTAEPTGIRDQLQGRDYGRGLWAQQGLALKRLWHRYAGLLFRAPGGKRA
jgi:sterol desaturase/sphingolipid hydroxylase (fatty acid hydroxylase superfamily)